MLCSLDQKCHRVVRLCSRGEAAICVCFWENNSMNKWHLLALIGTAYYYFTDFLQQQLYKEQKVQGNMCMAWPYYFIYSVIHLKSYYFSFGESFIKDSILLWLKWYYSLTYSSLQSLHWLPIKFRISYKILLLAYKALNDLAPAYLTNLLSRYNPTRSLRS